MQWFLLTFYSYSNNPRDCSSSVGQLSFLLTYCLRSAGNHPKKAMWAYLGFHPHISRTQGAELCSSWSSFCRRLLCWRATTINQSQSVYGVINYFKRRFEWPCVICESMAAIVWRKLKWIEACCWTPLALQFDGRQRKINGAAWIDNTIRGVDSNARLEQFVWSCRWTSNLQYAHLYGNDR